MMFLKKESKYGMAVWEINKRGLILRYSINNDKNSWWTRIISFERVSTWHYPSDVSSDGHWEVLTEDEAFCEIL